MDFKLNDPIYISLLTEPQTYVFGGILQTANAGLRLIGAMLTV
jgi:hypothetical protein